MFDFFIRNYLISMNQSGFKPGEFCQFSCQLLPITHGIYAWFEERYKVRGVFLDISKAFDKVRHEGFFFKLEQNGISRKLLHLIKYF